MQRPRSSQPHTQDRDMGDLWHAIISGSVDHVHRGSVHADMCVEHAVHHPQEALACVLQSPPTGDRSRETLMVLLSRADAMQPGTTDAWCQALPTPSVITPGNDTDRRKRIWNGALVYELGIAGGRRDIVDAAITTCLTAIGQRMTPAHMDVPAVWRGRATELGYSELFDQFSISVSPSMGQLSDIAQSRRLARVFTSGALHPEMASSHTAASHLLQRADSVADLGVATVMRATAIMAVGNDRCMPYGMDRLVRTDWASVSPDDQRETSGYALRRMLERTEHEQPAPRELMAWIVAAVSGSG